MYLLVSVVQHSIFLIEERNYDYWPLLSLSYIGSGHCFATFITDKSLFRGDTTSHIMLYIFIICYRFNISFTISDLDRQSEPPIQSEQLIVPVIPQLLQFLGQRQKGFLLARRSRWRSSGWCAGAGRPNFL